MELFYFYDIMLENTYKDEPDYSKNIRNGRYDIDAGLHIMHTIKMVINNIKYQKNVHKKKLSFKRSHSV